MTDWLNWSTTPGGLVGWFLVIAAESWQTRRLFSRFFVKTKLTKVFFLNPLVFEHLYQSDPSIENLCPIYQKYLKIKKYCINLLLSWIKWLRSMCDIQVVQCKLKIYYIADAFPELFLTRDRGRIILYCVDYCSELSSTTKPELPTSRNHLWPSSDTVLSPRQQAYS